jgi:DNA-binding MarR family transcriptional regulator
MTLCVWVSIGCIRLTSLDIEYLEIENIDVISLDVKRFVWHTRAMTTQADQHDHVDRFLETIHLVLPDLDLEVEGIVDRIGGIARRLNRMMDETVAEFGLDNVEHKALSVLTQSGPPFRSTPGKLARRMELSSGAMTNRLDRLEEAGYVQRLPDPDDRRGVVVELTDHGRETYRRAVGAQAKKEALMAAALSPREQTQLNSLLRRLMLEFERRERGAPDC